MAPAAAPNAPGIAFSLFNDDGTGNVYLKTSNTLTLLVENGYGFALAFADDGSSYLSLDFGGIVSDDALAALACSPGWTSSVVDGNLKLVPNEATTVAAGGTLIVSIGGVVVSNAPTIANVQLDLVLSASNGASASSAMAVLYAPSASSPPLPLSAVLSSGQVVIAAGSQPVANDLNITFVSQAVGTIAAATDTTILLSFVYGGGAGDLTTSTLGADVDVSILQQPGGNTTDWKPNPYTFNSMPVWQLTAGSPDAFGTQGDGVLVAGLGNVVTNAVPGTTDVYVAYSGFPGYSDASFRLPLAKVPQLAITSFTASTTSLDGTALPADVVLSFTVLNASYVTIVNAGYSAPVTSTSSTPYSGTATASVAGPTTFTLIATNATTGETASQSVAVATTPSPYDALPPGSIVMWSSATVPEGWQICDGGSLNGYTTPNLVAQFIQGADPTGTDAAVNDSGGPDTHVHLFSASLAGTASQGGSHKHSISLNSAGTGASTGWKSDFYPLVTKNNAKSNPSYDTASGGLHSHSVNVSGGGTTGTQSTSQMRPAWYALYFIMKCY